MLQRGAHLALPTAAVVTHRPAKSDVDALFSLFPSVQSMTPGKESVPPFEPIMPSFVPFASALPRARTEVDTRGGRRRRRTRSAVILLVLGVLAGLATMRVLLQGESKLRQRHEPRTVVSPSLRTTTTGQQVRWHRDSIDVVLDDSLSSISDGAADAYTAAISAWRGGGAELPSISTHTGNGLSVGYSASGANQNVVVFAKYGWAQANGALAVTVLTYDDVSGEILDADIVINGGGRYFAELTEGASTRSGEAVAIDPSSSSASTGSSTESVGTTAGQATADSTGVSLTSESATTTARFDLQSILTHEAGHSLGLGHDPTDTTSTMYAELYAGDTSKRHPTQSDQTELTTLYQGATTSPQQAQAGCGGAQIARRPTAWSEPSAPSFFALFGGASLLWILRSLRRPRRLEARAFSPSTPRRRR